MTSTAPFEAPFDLRVALLGPVEVESRAGGLIEPAGMLAKRFIAVLGLAAGRTVSTATIVDELWNDRLPASARPALQTLVSRLRAVCADGLIETSSSGYRLACRPEQVDLLLVERMLAAGESGTQSTADSRPRPTLGQLRSALDLWRGEAGADVAEGDLGQELAARAGAARQALDRLYADQLAACGEYEQAIGVLRGLRSEHPFDDTIVSRLLSALVSAKRPGEALTEFETHRRTLRDELGSTPSAEVLAAHAALLRSTAEVDDDDANVASTAAGAAEEIRATQRQPGHRGSSVPPMPAAKPLRLGLKAAPNALIGRGGDLAALNTMIDQARLVTILGAGGLGKTRLAQALAGDDARGSSAVIFVELASVRSPADLLLAIGQASGVREAQTASRLSEAPVRDDLDARIRGRLSEQPTLLVLDNCEHIVDSVAVWAAGALEQVPALRMLATSRSPLQIAAERVYALSPLSSGSTSGGSTEQQVGAAVQLFFERARAARPSVVLPRATVERLCDRLDGMPLAIELAAARVRSMTVDEIERRLTNRFALLTGGDRTAPERHQTLIAVIDWSWNLLNDTERQLLRRLSLFADGFSSSAAERVGGVEPVTDLLDALVNQSLVAVTESESTGTMRYRMLETVREFGHMALVDAGEDQLAAASMAQWASSFAIAVTPRLDGADQIATFRLVTEEQDNLVDIFRRALEQRDGETTTFVFSVLCAYWTIRGAHWELVGFASAFLEATRGYDPEAPREAHREAPSEAHRADARQIDDRRAPPRPEDSELTPDQHTIKAVEASVRCLVSVGTIGLFNDLRIGATARARLRKLTRIDEVPNERMRMAARFMLSAGNAGALTELMMEARNATDPMTSSYAWLTSTQFAENTGDISDALEFGRRGYEQALLAHDIWTQSMMSSMVAQLHSQSGHPHDALSWAYRARDGLLMLNADDDLQQLDWLIAMNRIMIGETENARTVIRTLTERTNSADGTVAPDMFSRDTASIGWSGQAEIDRMNGDTASALRNFHTAIDLFATTSERASPWFLMLGSVYLSAIAFDAVVDPAELNYAARLARRLRSRILATHRARPQFLDLPVLGCTLIGLSAHLMSASPDEALTFLALAERLGSRQDSPALSREAHLARASALCGPDAVADARAAVADLDPRESATLTFSLLKESRALRTPRATGIPA